MYICVCAPPFPSKNRCFGHSDPKCVSLYRDSLCALRISLYRHTLPVQGEPPCTG